MANRIPWDKYEVVILIDASIKVINKEITKQDAVKKVSLMLRTKAATSGIIIDNIFRNENGISMQMNIILALIQNKSSGLHNASKLFCEMVNIYKSNPTLYLQVLTEAKGMIRTLSSSNDDKLNNAYSDNEKTIDIGNAEEGLHSNSTYPEPVISLAVKLPYFFTELCFYLGIWRFIFIFADKLLFLAC